MPKGIAVLLGAGPQSGAGIARAFAKHGYAVALLARNAERISELAHIISSKEAPAAAFATDTSRSCLERAFRDIQSHKAFQGLPFKAAIWHVKHASKGPFLEQSDEAFEEMFNTYILGAKIFAQLALPLLIEGNTPDAPGTLIFTGTLGAMRCSAQYASYGISRAAVRHLSQSLAREYIEKQIHVVHTIINGPVGEDEDKISAGSQIHACVRAVSAFARYTTSRDALGENYVWLTEQKADCFAHELDLRPAAEKF